MIRVSREVIVVADCSKFRRRSLSVIASLDRVHKVITDDRAPREMIEALKAQNVEVIVV
jgi:DeoR/GlpR family transcriptional regulator of sugar metabolism